MKTIVPRLSKYERVVCAYAQPAHGLQGDHDWINTPLWVIVRGDDGRLREEVIQPDQQSKELEALYEIAAAVHVAMLSALAIHYGKQLGESDELHGPQNQATPSAD